MSNRDVYIDKFAAQLKEWSAKMDVLKGKADQAGADTRIKYQNELEALRAKRTAAEAKLKELKNAGEGAWEDIKRGCDRSWNEFKSAVESATSQFK